ncbi:MAG: bifunctional DNA primase/polymerase [Cyanobacteriota bacterium]|jgi:hypothetical protein
MPSEWPADSPSFVVSRHDACALLRAIPDEHRQHLIPCGANKAPIPPRWQHPALRFSDQALISASAIGLRLGHSGIIAVDLDPPDDNSDAALLKLEQVTGHPVSDLPPSWSWSSGRPGRRQIGLIIPIEKRAGIKATSHKVLEFRWLGQQSIIHGVHPLTGAYRWLPGCSPIERPLAVAPDWLIEAIKPPPPRAYQPSRPHRSGDRSPADWCRYYLQFWPNHDLPYDLWWATVCAMHRAGLPVEEARGWSASSSKHTGREFDSQWEKVGRRNDGYGIEWLGSVTKGNRPGREANG